MPDDEIITTDTTDEDPTPEPTPTWTILNDVKLALRLTTDAYDNQLNALIAAALADLGIAGVTSPTAPAEGEETAATDDPLVKTAVITYCIVHFGSPADYDRLKKSYNEQKAQLMTATGYTDWGDT